VIVETIRDQNPAVRQKRDILRLAEVRLVAAFHTLLAERLQQLLAVVGKDVDLTEGLVHHPDAVLRIVRADSNPMRSRSVGARAERIPLRPPLFYAAVTVERVETVAPDAAVGRVEHVDADRAGETREAGRQRIRQSRLAALRDEDAVRRLREHARIAAEREAGFRKWLVPAANDGVRARTGRRGAVG